jgi:hypothetical protein
MRLRDPYEAACVRGRAIPLINMIGGTAPEAGWLLSRNRTHAVRPCGLFLFSIET